MPRQSQMRRSGRRHSAMRCDDRPRANNICISPARYTSLHGGQILSDKEPSLAVVSTGNRNTGQASSTFDFPSTNALEIPYPNKTTPMEEVTLLFFHKLTAPAGTSARFLYNLTGTDGWYCRIQNGRSAQAIFFMDDASTLIVAPAISTAWGEQDFTAIRYNKTTGVCDIFDKTMAIIGTGTKSTGSKILSANTAKATVFGWGGTDYTTGEIGEFRIFPYPMTDAQIKGFYNKYRHLYGL